MNEVLTKEEILEEMERTKWKRIFKTMLKDWRLYLLLLPSIIFFFLFRYLPMAGLFTSFKANNTNAGGTTFDILFNYDWQGLRYAKTVIFGVESARFWASFRNTFVISMYGLCFTFPVPILLALFFSEIKNEFWRSAVQICAYLPKFISTVVCTTLVLKLLDSGASTGGSPGVLVTLLNKLHIIPESVNQAEGAAINGASTPGMMGYPQYFRAVYSISGVWEGSGYGSIVYFAAIMGISPTGYEAAKIDGANKMAQIRYVTLPGMAPTLTIMLILRIGDVLNVGYEKVLLLVSGYGNYNVTQGHLGSWKTAEVLTVYVYRIGIETTTTGGQQMGSVADLFNAVIAMCLVLGANFISRRVSTTSLF